MDPRKRNVMARLEQAGTTYPRVINLESRSLQGKINLIIRETAYDAIPDYDPGTSIIEAQSGYTTPLNMKGILSLRFQDYFYPEMAAHGVTGVSSVTLDLNTGQVYRFSDLFRRGSNYQATLNRIIQAQITARQIPMLKPFEGVGPDEEYYLTPENLVIYYQPYVYTPGAFGVLEFSIPYAQITNLVNPRGPIGIILEMGD
ncbi:MAG TPA: DUF3298 domain-containing protein [Bacillota bacterium]|nr:DUF3298 domain-containing protein [Bacillota bacterium]